MKAIGEMPASKRNGVIFCQVSYNAKSKINCLKRGKYNNFILISKNKSKSNNLLIVLKKNI